MAMRLHVGMSSAPDARGAASQAIGAALRGATWPAFALIFCTDRYDADELAAAVGREIGMIPWAGCCAPGVFAGAEILEQGVTVGVFSTEDTAFGVGMGGPVSRDARAAGREAGAQAVKELARSVPPTGRAFIVLTDAFAGNASAVVRGVAYSAGAGAVWAGGGTGDNLHFVHNAQFAHGRAWRDRAVVIAIDASHAISVGMRHGWRPYGTAVTITRSSGVTAKELDYQSAFHVYQETAARHGERIDEGSFARFAMSHPLGIPQTDGEFVIRDPFAVDLDGGLRCVAEVPEGAIVRVMQGARDDLIAAARVAAVDARDGLDRSPGGAIVFDCVSRSLLLGRGVRDELAALQAGIGPDVPLMGCLSIGEVGAFGHAAPQFHNKTAVVIGLPGAESRAMLDRSERRAESHEIPAIEPLAHASALQELTVAALELFDPQRRPDPFLDRVAERVGCYAAMLFETDAGGRFVLTGANGLATESRALPVARGEAPALELGCPDARLHYPELERPGLVCWRFPMGTPEAPAELQLSFTAARPFSPILHGMVERLARTLGTVLVNRRLLARTFESERNLATERDAVAEGRAMAERANASKGEFLAVISHEIRNRLNPVIQWTRLLRGRELSPEGITHALEVIERNALMQSRLIEDLLDLDRASSGTFSLDPVEIDLHRLAVEEAEVLGAAAAAKGVELRVRANAKPAMIRADADRMRQVVANLLENALKFTPKGGRIEASATREASVVRFAVEDSGRGIPVSELPTVFDLFTRGNTYPADRSPGSRGSGLGIGLALVRRIVETHGGTVRVTSPGVDQGTTFTVELPASVSVRLVPASP